MVSMDAGHVNTLCWIERAGTGGRAMILGSALWPCCVTQRPDLPGDWQIWAKRFSGVLCTPRLLLQFVEQRLGFLEVGRVKALGEPALDRG